MKKNLPVFSLKDLIKRAHRIGLCDFLSLVRGQWFQAISAPLLWLLNKERVQITTVQYGTVIIIRSLNVI